MRERKFTFWVTSDKDGIIVEERIPYTRNDDRRYKYDTQRIFITWEELEKIKKIKT